MASTNSDVACDEPGAVLQPEGLSWSSGGGLRGVERSTDTPLKSLGVQPLISAGIPPPISAGIPPPISLGIPPPISLGIPPPMSAGVPASNSQLPSQGTQRVELGQVINVQGSSMQRPALHLLVPLHITPVHSGSGWHIREPELQTVLAGQ